VSTKRCRFRPVTFLAASKPLPTTFSSLDALAIEDGGAGALLLDGLVPYLRPRRAEVADLLPGDGVTPLAEVIVAGAPGGQVMRYHAPGATAPHDGENAAQGLAEVDGAGAAAGFGRWQQWP
jgi:hypothetical protein